LTKSTINTLRHVNIVSIVPNIPFQYEKKSILKSEDKKITSLRKRKNERKKEEREREREKKKREGRGREPCCTT
jgi:hypothetical protein